MLGAVRAETSYAWRSLKEEVGVVLVGGSDAPVCKGIQGIQRFTSCCALGSVKFVPAVAYLLCLALPGSVLLMFCAPL